MTLAAPHALLLMQADPGRADDVASFVSRLPPVTEAAVTSGPYDVIATIDLTEVSLAHVVHLARRAPGLCDLRVCRSGDAVRGSAAPAWRAGGPARAGARPGG